MMRSSRPAGPSTFARVLAIGAAIVLMLVVLSLLIPSRPPDGPPDTALTRTDAPIPAEAQVFRIRAGNLAADPEAQPRREAQPRTLAIYRRLRAFPGAPPRVPHALTDEEFRYGLCNSCHQRGGFVTRFGGYAPVTPHPEFRYCLQCHPADAMSVGVPLPDRPGGLPCGQCHVDPDRPPPSLVSLDWAPLAWPALDQTALEGSPPLIPHDLDLRGNCLACHGGPGAVRELRTLHPERTNCRQCHVPVGQGVPDFARTALARPQDSGGS